MKICRFIGTDSEEHYGVIKEKWIHELKDSPFESISVTSSKHKVSDIKFLAPCIPSKIIAVGLNYKDHAREMNKDLPSEPMLFMKPSTTVIGHEDDIIYPSHMSSRVDYEGELAVVMGKTVKHVTPEKSADYILGYTCMNDVTARDLQSKDVQFTRAKGFDTFAPIGPVIETGLDPSDLHIRTYLNGSLKQNSSTSNLIFTVPELISFVSKVMTLYPGDVISTGTPSGIAPMTPGDTVEVEIEGIGLLRNYVKRIN